VRRSLSLDTQSKVAEIEHFSDLIEFFSEKTVTDGRRVARFFLLQHTKTGKNIPNDHKFTKRPQNRASGRKFYQMTLKCTGICHYKAFHKLPKLVFLV
jgi:hypothetical protein